MNLKKHKTQKTLVGKHILFLSTGVICLQTLFNELWAIKRRHRAERKTITHLISCQSHSLHAIMIYLPLDYIFEFWSIVFDVLFFFFHRRGIIIFNIVFNFLIFLNIWNSMRVIFITHAFVTEIGYNTIRRDGDKNTLMVGAGWILSYHTNTLFPVYLIGSEAVSELLRRVYPN